LASCWNAHSLKLLQTSGRASQKTSEHQTTTLFARSTVEQATFDSILVLHQLEAIPRQQQRRARRSASEPLSQVAGSTLIVSPAPRQPSRCRPLDSLLPQSPLHSTSYHSTLSRRPARPSTMLDRLPTELLLRTLELAAPLDYSPSFYLERRLLLRNCCLVSRKVRGVAQPMLPEVYRVGRNRDIAWLKAEGNGKMRGERVKTLALDGHKLYKEASRTYSHLIEPGDLVKLVPAVSELSWCGGGALDLSVLAKLPCLSSVSFASEAS
jgi:hypothetical protein